MPSGVDDKAGVAHVIMVCMGSSMYVGSRGSMSGDATADIHAEGLVARIQEGLW